MANILTVLNTLEDLEIAMRDLYAWLSAHFTDDTCLSAFFRKLSSEEEAHAGTVRYQKRLVRQNPDSIDEVSADLEEIRELTEMVCQTISEKPNMTPQEALKLATNLESMDEERLYRKVILETLPELAPLIQNLTRNDESHVQDLENFVASYFESVKCPVPESGS